MGALPVETTYKITLCWSCASFSKRLYRSDYVSRFNQYGLMAEKEVFVSKKLGDHLFMSAGVSFTTLQAELGNKTPTPSSFSSFSVSSIKIYGLKHSTLRTYGTLPAFPRTRKHY